MVDLWESREGGEAEACAGRDEGGVWALAEALARRAGVARGGGWRGALEARELAPWRPGWEGAPSVLLVRGRAPEAPGVAVVGSRAVDPYGAAVASEVAADAVKLGRWVVSGGAEGCDAAAHRRAIGEGGRTVVVLASGHDHPYPRSHQGLFDDVVEAGGAIVSAYWPTTRPARHRFLARNEVIAQLSDVVVVARAAARSGALSTAAAGRRLGRVVMAVPGDVGEAMSQGAHRLLVDGARPLVSAGCLARALGERCVRRGWPVRHLGSPPPWALEKGGGLDEEGLAEGGEAERVLEAVASDSGLDLDALVVRTELPVDAVAAALLDLELMGHIIPLPGDRYAAVRRR